MPGKMMIQLYMLNELALVEIKMYCSEMHDIYNFRVTPYSLVRG